MIDLFKGQSLKSITSINFGKVVDPRYNAGGDENPFLVGNIIQPTSSLTKIILPFAFDWNSLSIDVKQNLRVISLMFRDPYQPIPFNPIDFPNLRHVHTKPNRQGIFPDIPSCVNTITFLGPVSWRVIDTFSKANISTLRVRLYDLEKNLYLNKITSLKKLVLFSSSTTICQNQFNYFINDMGFDYYGSSLSIQSNTKKLIYIKRDSETNHSTITNNNNNNNNNNNYQIDQQQVVSTPTSINNNNNIILPNTIINKIIKMTWKLRERCTCVYEKETIQKWIKIGYDILKDEQELDRFNEMKNNCPTHFSHTQPYKPLTYDLKSSNRSKLQLGLINKDIFNYIAKNCFSIVDLEYHRENATQHIKNQYCVAFKHFTTIIGSSDQHFPRILLNIKDNHPHITKVILYNLDYLQDIIKLLPNLSSIDFSKPRTNSYGNIDITNLHKLKHLTKLDLTSAYFGDDSRLIDEIKDMPLKKLCLSNNFLYRKLPLWLKQSITKISASPFWGYLDQFPNIQHIVIDNRFSRDSSWCKLPNTVTKVTCTEEIGFLPHNKSVRKVILKTRWQENITGPFLFLKTLSSPQCSHVQTIIYCCPDTFQVPNDLFNDFKYQIDYSRTSLDDNKPQYLKLSRINQNPVSNQDSSSTDIFKRYCKIM
ncbi:hypothetical protein DFA_11344 [Cavenderia fasciculata]|uniref:Uncharacterized protein n=1 Tax=Cavenderia fasciculata TaxID=261658 RepID=F4QCE8_CACFS|nr:uncharacterized protein DFA_11344 [Cavenderia fasciculata]EGG13583.1 hypothetical protein DFA_11344 [Cavenderia fasciculata]|eukprot:XP_004350287.1 hypothetical protein DFA_11344 [Cavenderia fasciculata]